jgi:2'-5' RNA ligase
VSDFARLFFALRPNLATRREIVARRQALGLPGRPVAPALLHATLAFLGNQPRHRIGELLALAAERQIPQVELRLNRVGSFPRAGVVWLGTDTVPERLLAFRAGLVGALAAAGFAIERQPWIPHLTLYRNLRSGPATMDIDPVQWTVDRYLLMESSSGPAGLRYRVCGRWRARPVQRRRGSV